MAPMISALEINEIVLDLYGLKVMELRELLGYDDKNFLLKVDVDVNKNKNVKVISEKGYVFKVVNLFDSENDALFEGQTAVLFELEKFNIMAPKTIFTVNNKPFLKIKLKSGDHIIRLLEYIEGTTLFKVGRLTSDICFQVGETAAKIDNVLENFDHSAYEKPNSIPWSIASVCSQVKECLHAITDHCRKKLCQKIISEFSEKVMSQVDELQTGMIHGDINEQNLLMEQDSSTKKWQLKAIIDFGDSHRGCYIFELSIAMAYMILQSDSCDSIENGGHVLAGYLSVRNMPKEELDLLVICIKARLVQSLVMGAYANSKDPSNTYVLTTAVKGWKLLTDLEQTAEEDVLAKWRKVAEQNKDNESK